MEDTGRTDFDGKREDNPRLTGDADDEDPGVRRISESQARLILTMKDEG